MKKLWLTFSLVICVTAITIAQPRAIGLRFGYFTEASYQHSLGEKAFIQLDLGATWNFREVAFSPTFNFSIAKPNWTSKGEWEFYAGPGLSTGFNRGWKYFNSNDRYGDYFYLGLSGMFGLSYTFWFPLQLSVDFRPTLIGFSTLDHYDDNMNKHEISLYSDFYIPDYYGSNRFFYPNIAISARYAFGK